MVGVKANDERVHGVHPKGFEGHKKAERVNQSGSVEHIDVFGEAVTLTDSVRDVILAKHPETSGFIDRLGSVLQQPDQVRQSVSDARCVLYYRHDDDVLGGKWIVVVVKQTDAKFVSTLYATDTVKSGEVLWKK